MSNLDAVKAATWDLHIKAERSGVIADILVGRASRYGVALLLRNLLPVYQVLDTSRCCLPGLARGECILADLSVLWPGAALPLLPEGAAYADMVGRAGEDALIAHGYVRYLGDLNGGRILRRRLLGCLGDVAHSLTFHEYPALDDDASFARDYRDVIDRAVGMADFDAVMRACVAAFEMNIALSEAVRAAAARADGVRVDGQGFAASRFT